MSRLEELIQQLCPDGVEFRALGEIVHFLNGRAYKQSELLDKGKYKVLRVGNFYTNDKWYYSNLELNENKYCKEGDLLYTWAATLGPQIWTGEKVIFHYHIWKLVFDQTVIDKRFLYYVLSKDTECISNSLTQSTMPHVSMASMSKRLVPVPPLEVQREIVRILDQFTELTEELTTKLTSEFTARKKQYEYYRDELLDFGNRVGYQKLGEVVDIRRGIRVVKSQLSGNGMYPVYQNSLTPLGLYDKRNVESNTTFIIVAGAAGEIGYSTVDFWAADDCFYFACKDNIINKYIYYILLKYKYQLLSKVRNASIPRLSRMAIEQIQIPIPPIKEQRRIVSILDRFDTLCNDLTSGLPAEIEVRRKQYEYYLDKLLTFSERKKQG